tara:strand:+ start:1624 stop:2139 length:516 start_codon:yes stop_codon:yes gene_type:complete
MIVVMASGNGSNFENIVQCGIKVDLLVTDNPDAGVIDRAERLNIECKISETKYESIVPKNCDLVILAGFMKILSPKFVARRRVVNIHPSLLPSFRGANAVEQSLAAGVKISGCTMHWVDSGMDTGEIISQSACRVLESDSVSTLTDRIQVLEYELYPRKIKEVLVDMWIHN